jgi:uncharacterized membrane protein
LGYFYAARRQDWKKIRLNYLRRGLFLLTIGHLIITLSHYPLAGSIPAMVRWFFITDTIGIAIIAGPFLVGWLSRGVRLAAALAMMILTMAVLLFVPPHGMPERVLLEFFFGPVGAYADRWFADVFPVVPWFALFIAGSVVGEYLGKQGRTSMVSELLTRILGVASLAVGALLQAAHQIARGYSGPWVVKLVRTSLFSFESKLPPSVTYFLLYAGVGLLVLSCLLFFERKGSMTGGMSMLEVMGRNSLFVFIVQYIVYFSFIEVMHIGYTPFWPAIFAVSVVFIWVCAVASDRWKWNKLLTIPMPVCLTERMAG